MQKFYSLIIIITTIISIILIKENHKNSSGYFMGQNDTIEQMRGVQAYQYDKSGDLINYMLADDWKFSTVHQTSTFNNPHVVVFKAPNYIYVINSNFGKILHKDFNSKLETIKLFNKVQVEKKSSNILDKSGFKLNTDYLEFDPLTELATTDKAVTIYKHEIILNAIGMEANLKTHQMELKSNVVTEYHQQPNQSVNK